MCFAVGNYYTCMNTLHPCQVNYYFSLSWLQSAGHHAVHHSPQAAHRPTILSAAPVWWTPGTCGTSPVVSTGVHNVRSVGYYSSRIGCLNPSARFLKFHFKRPTVYTVLRSTGRYSSTGLRSTGLWPTQAYGRYRPTVEWGPRMTGIGLLSTESYGSRKKSLKKTTDEKFCLQVT